MNKRVALVIGIGHYIYNETLECCPFAAKDVYQLLINPSIGGCDHDKSKIIAVDKEEYVFTEAELGKEITHALGLLSPGDQFIFFFSGHATLTDNDELVLLLPNSRRGGQGCLQSYHFSSLITKMKIAKINKAIIIIDACHSAAMFNSFRHLQGEMTNWNPHLPKGFGFMASCKQKERSRQSNELNSTFFSHHFCNGLEEWPNKQSKYITLTEMKNYINENLGDDAKQEVQILLKEGNEGLWIAKNKFYLDNDNVAALDLPEEYQINLDQDYFIGRHEILDNISSFFDKKNLQQVICIQSSGGIGKTRLLRHLLSINNNKYYNGERIIFLDIIDFDDDDCLSPKHVGRKIAEGIGREKFLPYYKKQQQYHQMVISGVNIDELDQVRQDIRREFANCFNSVSEKQRIVLSFDTTDRLEKNKGMWAEFASISNLNNVCILLSGQNANDIGMFLKNYNIFVKFIPLKNLDKDESLDYLQHKMRSKYLDVKMISEELYRKLIYLSSGEPIWLDLIVECLRNKSIIFEYLNDMTIKDIDKGDEKRKIKVKMIKEITDKRILTNKLIRIMAHIYPVNEEMIHALIGKNIAGNGFIDEVKKFIFIKHLPGGYIRLHDEIRKMIQEEIFSNETISERIEFSEKIIKYSKEKIHALKKDIENIADNNEINANERYLKKSLILRKRHSILLYQVHHAFFVNTDRGIATYSDVIWKLRRDSRIRVAMHIQESVKHEISRLNESQKRKYEILRARLLNDSGKTEEAENVLEGMLPQAVSESEEYADICNALAPVKLRLGKLKEALSNQRKSFDIFERVNKDHLADIANYNGYLYEKTGDLNRAIECYNDALTYTAKADKASKNLMAKIYDNLSHVYCQKGYHAEAQDYLDQAMEIWKSINEDSQIARGKITQGVIFRDQRRYDDSISLITEAIELLREDEDHQKFIKAFFHLGWTLWFKAIEEKNENYLEILEKAKKYFERSRELAEQYHMKADLPGILHQMSNVYYLLEDKDAAISINKKAYSLSKEVHDIRYAVDSLVGMAEFDFYKKEYNQIEEYARILKEEYEDNGYDFPRFYGRMKRIIADVAFSREDYGTALNNYIIGLAQIRKHRGYGPYTIDKELKQLKEKISEYLQKKTAREWYLKMSEVWREEQKTSKEDKDKYALLISWSHRQLVGLQ